MEKTITTINAIATIFSQAVKSTLEKSTKKTIKYSDTIQCIPKIGLRPDIGSFVQFNGDYNGLVVMNFSEGAAMDIYRYYMTTMGLNKDDLATNYTSTEVVDTIGEMTNQIMGKAMSMVENKYELCANFSQPKSLALNNPITLIPDLEYSDNRRIAFRIETNRFYLELSLEKTEFVSMGNLL